MGENSTPEDLFRRTRLGIARLRESQQQLVRDIQERYSELGMAVDQLRSYFHSSSDSSDDDDYVDVQDEDISFSKGNPHSKCRKKTPKSEISKLPVPQAAVTYLQDRQYGYRPRSSNAHKHRQFVTQTLPDFVSQNLPGILSEKELDLDSMNKVFASKWLNNYQVVFGTKCNKLRVMDVRTNDLVSVPTLKSSSPPAECPCGIHAIAINQSRTLLATGGQNVNDLAVYELPTFDPLCVGEKAHTDWIFDLDFIDDRHIITGARDSTLAIWRLPNDLSRCTGQTSESMDYGAITPVRVETCNDAHRVRALGLGRDKRIMGVLSMDAKFHFWDLERFKQLDTMDLRPKRENVCVASSDDLGVFAVGSESYVTLLDHRRPRTRRGCSPKNLAIPAKYRESGEMSGSSWPSRGIRSVSFNEKMITIGTGDGRLLFYDIRNSSFLQQDSGRHHELCVGAGWLRNDHNYRSHFQNGHYPNAIYTHCYDQAKGRIFTAGGPLPAGLYGNYAGMFY